MWDATEHKLKHGCLFTFGINKYANLAKTSVTLLVIHVLVIKKLSAFVVNRKNWRGLAFNLRRQRKACVCSKKQTKSFPFDVLHQQTFLCVCRKSHHRTVICFVR